MAREYFITLLALLALGSQMAPAHASRALRQTQEELEQLAAQQADLAALVADAGHEAAGELAAEAAAAAAAAGNEAAAAEAAQAAAEAAANEKADKEARKAAEEAAAAAAAAAQENADQDEEAQKAAEEAAAAAAAAQDEAAREAQKAAEQAADDGASSRSDGEGSGGSGGRGSVRMTYHYYSPNYETSSLYCADVFQAPGYDKASLLDRAWTAYCVDEMTQDKCGKSLCVTNPATGQSTRLVVVDMCGHGGLDTDPIGFNAIDGDGAGVRDGHMYVNMEWC